MLNNFCFHVYAEKSLIIAENSNAKSDRRWEPEKLKKNKNKI